MAILTDCRFDEEPRVDRHQVHTPEDVSSLAPASTGKVTRIGHRPAGDSANAFDTAILDDQIIGMRRQGLSFSRIGIALGLTKQSVHDRWRRLIEVAADTNAERVAEIMFEELDRLEQITESMWPSVVNPHVPEFRPSPESVLAYIKVSEAKRKLFGVDGWRPPGSQEDGLTPSPAVAQVSEPVIDFGELADRLTRSGLGSGRSASQRIE